METTISIQDTRMPVPEELINQIGFKKGNMIITGFAEIPTKHNEHYLHFYVFGVMDKGKYTSHDVDQWRHNQRLRNAGRWATIKGHIFGKMPIKKIHATSLAISA